jgi:hypothetical protein
LCRTASFLQQQSAGSLPVLSAVVSFRLPRPAAGAYAAGRVDVPGAHRGRCGVSGGNSAEQAELCWLRSGQGTGPSYLFVARMVRILVLLCAAETGEGVETDRSRGSTEPGRQPC